MQTLSEQMSSAGQAHLQAQLDLFGRLASAAIDNAGKLALLQLHAARDTLDRSHAMWFGMLSAGSPGWLRQPEAPAAEERTSRQEAQTPAVPVAPAIDEPNAVRTPIAQAAAQVAPPVAPMQPVASPLPAEGKVELPRVRPLEADPPPPPAGARPRRRQLPRK